MIPVQIDFPDKIWWQLKELLHIQRKNIHKWAKEHAQDDITWWKSRAVRNRQKLARAMVPMPQVECPIQTVRAFQDTCTILGIEEDVGMYLAITSWCLEHRVNPEHYVTGVGRGRVWGGPAQEPKLHPKTFESRRLPKYIAKIASEEQKAKLKEKDRRSK